jgi:hypothetical protein
MGFYEHDIEPFGSIKGIEFVDQLSVLLSPQERLCFLMIVS